jgi:hypothetical protein
MLFVQAALWSAVDDDDLVLVRTLLHRHALFASPDIDASARNRREVPTGRLRDRSGRSPLFVFHFFCTEISKLFG